MNYRRVLRKGGIYFFTVNLLQQQKNDLLTKHIDVLCQDVSSVRQRHPFIIHGWVVLPDHLHALELPVNDADYAIRWRRIKSGFSKSMPKQEYRSVVRLKRGERGI